MSLGVSLTPAEIEVEMLDCAPLDTLASFGGLQSRARTAASDTSCVILMTFFTFSDWFIRKDTRYGMYAKGLVVKVAAERQKVTCDV